MAADNSLPLSTILHMITVKLSPTNYLLWRNQLLPLLKYQKLSDHVDGTLEAPPSTTSVEGVDNPNPAYATWLEADQRACLIIQSSLSETAMAEILNLSTARAVWTRLEHAYRQDSQERKQTLKDTLRQLKKGTSTVSEFSLKFRSICDQLSAIGHPVDDLDKHHWFLCGLGSAFETFSTTQRAITPKPSFLDLVSHAEGHELFLAAIQDSTPPVAAFTANRQSSPGGL